MNRRQFLKSTSAATLALAASAPSCVRLSNPGEEDLIIDTHQHLWDLDKIRPPWLAGAPPILRQRYANEEYGRATEGFNVRTVYMEVDVAPQDHFLEADSVVAQCRARNTPMIAATIGGRPASDDFHAYARRYANVEPVKGIRQVLHGESTPAGFCLEPGFVRGVRALGENGLNFELTMRPTELQDAAKLTERCPDTRFVLDHCGNGDPKAFRPNLAPEMERRGTADQWRRGLDACARRPNVVCKISGIVASVPPGRWRAEDLAPVVTHCLDAFGPDRVFFGGDWPVCLLGSPLKDWITALREIVSSRPKLDQRKLWSLNAIKFYRLKI